MSSAFQQALAASTSTPTTSIRGAASGASNNRGIRSALNAAGIAKDANGMEVDGGVGRARGAGRRGNRSAGPMDQSGRHRRNDAPYAKPINDDRGEASRPLASRMGGRGGRINPNAHPGRLPVGAPITIDIRPEHREAQKAAQAKLSEKLSSEEMKNWLRAHHIAEGVMDMSNLSEDPWLKEQGILSPGHQDAPRNAGMVIWALIDSVIQQPSKTLIHTLSLANNNLSSLHQLARLPYYLPHLRALDLSHNPIVRVSELDELLAAGEKKGKATAGIGSLKSLIELKLNDCLFREKMLGNAKGGEIYQHEILRRFPGLLILDSVNLNRVVFALDRKPKVRRSESERRELTKKPFTFPADVQGGFMETDICRSFVMEFCAKFFPLFDNDRHQLPPAYAPSATISMSANSINSYSLLNDEVKKTSGSRPKTAPFDAWVNLPSRNFFRTATSIDQRMKTLKSPADPALLMRWWMEAVPKTLHPLEDASKWCVDSWVLDGEGVNTKLCAMIQGEFQEMPSGTFRSFSRTFILADAPQGSPARNAGWPATILSDTTIVHTYLSTGAFDDHRSIAKHGVTIQPPQPITAPTSAPNAQAPRETLIQQMRERTRMNIPFATLCLEQNGWDFDTAVKNFEEIKASIPAEAFN